MKRFRFPLRPVAVLREHRELRAREVFAAAVHAYVLSEENLATTRTRVARLEAALLASRQGRFNAIEAAEAFGAYRRECAAEAEAERASFAARAEMDQRRGEYLEAHRKLDIIRRFETKARATHRFETNREEQAEFDDLAGRRLFRRRLSPV
jgi:flagellar FliJ protein